MNKGQIIGNCAQEVVHSGRENCAVIPGKTTYLFFHPQNATYSLERDAFIEQLSTFITSNPNIDRIIPVGTVSGNTPSGGDLTTAAPGNYGGTSTTGINPTTVAYQIENGTPCLFKELSKWNRRTLRVFHRDNNGLITGTVRTVGGVEKFAGYLVTVYVYEVQPTGTEGYQLWINLDYSAEYENEKMNRHGFIIGVQEIAGIIGLRLVSSAGGVVVTTDCGGEDVTEKYADEWEPSVFVNETGANPTAVTYNAETRKLTIVPPGKYKIADAATLEAAGITESEGINFYITI